MFCTCTDPTVTVLARLRSWIGDAGCVMAYVGGSALGGKPPGDDVVLLGHALVHLGLFWVLDGEPSMNGGHLVMTCRRMGVGGMKAGQLALGGLRSRTRTWNEDGEHARESRLRYFCP
jgi:hypothetical protein